MARRRGLRYPRGMDALWWREGTLDLGPRGLVWADQPVVNRVRDGTPVYLYCEQTVRQRLSELRSALPAPSRVYYAMKANRFGPLLDAVRREGDVGIDAASPGEVHRALAAGFLPGEISAMTTMPSNRDLRAFADARVHLNFDTWSAIRRWRDTPGAGRGFGIRIDPGPAMSEGLTISYGSSKFGVAPDRVIELARRAEGIGLVVDTLHMHPGWGMQTSAKDGFDSVLAVLADLAGALPDVHTLNLGGGLSWRHLGTDHPLALATWSERIRERLGPLGRTIVCESGTYVTASAGLLVVEVNTVERRGATTWVGVDAGHNVNVYAAHYGLRHQILHVRDPLAEPHGLYTIGGNINEAGDVFARDVALPEVREGDLLAFFPAGAYGASMASDHCLRGLPAEVWCPAGGG